MQGRAFIISWDICPSVPLHLWVVIGNWCPGGWLFVTKQRSPCAVGTAVWGAALWQDFPLVEMALLYFWWWRWRSFSGIQQRPLKCGFWLDQVCVCYDTHLACPKCWFIFPCDLTINDYIWWRTSLKLNTKGIIRRRFIKFSKFSKLICHKIWQAFLKRIYYESWLWLPILIHALILLLPPSWF